MLYYFAVNYKFIAGNSGELASLISWSSESDSHPTLPFCWRSVLFNRKEQSRQYYIKNREKILEYHKKYREENKEKCLDRTKKWRKENLEYCNEYGKKYSSENREHKLEYAKEHREEKRILDKQYRIEHKKESSEYGKLYRATHKDEILQRNSKNKNKRYKTDLKYNINCKVRVGVTTSLKGNKDGQHWEDLVGYTSGDLIKRLKQTIPKGYTWEDYLKGKLHIDHIIPMSVFNFTLPEHIDFKRCWSLGNLQLLPASENISKSNKLYKPFQASLKLGVCNACS